MISAICWVPRGGCKANPSKFVPSAEEIRMMEEMATKELQEEEEMMMEQLSLEEEDQKTNPIQQALKTIEDEELPASFRMDEYDQEDNEAAIRDLATTTEDDLLNMTEEEQEDDEMDQQLDDDFEEDEDEDQGSDKEDNEIRQNDAVLLVANTEEDFSCLEVHIYDDESANLYVHHDIALPAFPLCLSWMNCAPTITESGDPVDGSYVAVGTFKTGIEIWNLDVLDVLEPSAVLGGELDSDLRNVAVPEGMKKGRRNKQAPLKVGSHQDAVMSLDWHDSHRNLLASGSADNTVKIWDITTQTCLHTFTHHTDKVQSVRWNPVESTILASASFDRTIVVVDGRNPESLARFPLSADVESLVWSPHCPSVIVASTEDGMIVGYDVRSASADPVFNFQAHDKGVSAISFSSKIPGMFATASVDKTVKIWDLQDGQPACIACKEMCVGEIFTMSFYLDSPFLLSVGGSKGVLAIWDTSENAGVEKKFSSRIVSLPIAKESLNFATNYTSPDQVAAELLNSELTENAPTESTKAKKGKKSKKKKSKK